MAYKNFDINGNYSVYQKTTFELTEEYFKKKIDNYNLQDTCAKRCILGNITMADFNYFRDSLVNAKCHGFTSNNKTTLNQKNNKIGWCCNYCNSVKADRDGHYTRLYVQLRRLLLLQKEMKKNMK
jgi:hypothetical protein